LLVLCPPHFPVRARAPNRFASEFRQAPFAPTRPETHPLTWRDGIPVNPAAL